MVKRDSRIRSHIIAKDTIFLSHIPVSLGNDPGLGWTRTRRSHGTWAGQKSGRDCCARARSVDADVVVEEKGLALSANGRVPCVEVCNGNSVALGNRVTTIAGADFIEFGAGARYSSLSKGASAWWGDNSGIWREKRYLVGRFGKNSYYLDWRWSDHNILICYFRRRFDCCCGWRAITVIFIVSVRICANTIVRCSSQTTAVVSRWWVHPYEFGQREASVSDDTSTVVEIWSLNPLRASRDFASGTGSWWEWGEGSFWIMTAHQPEYNHNVPRGRK